MSTTDNLAREFVQKHKANGSWTMTLSEWDELEIALAASFLDIYLKGVADGADTLKDTLLSKDELISKLMLMKAPQQPTGAGA